MPRKRHTPEEIVTKLRQVDVLVAQGQSVADAVRSIGVTEVTYYRWRQEFGGLKTEQIKRRKELEAENARLRRAVADLTLGKLTLKEAASGNCCAPRGAAPASSTPDGSFKFPSGAPVQRSTSTARRSAGSRGAGTTVRSAAPHRLTADIIELARQYGRYGYRKIAERRRATAGWVVDDERVERSTAALAMAARGAQGATQAAQARAAQARAALAGGRILP